MFGAENNSFVYRGQFLHIYQRDTYTHYIASLHSAENHILQTISGCGTYKVYSLHHFSAMYVNIVSHILHVDIFTPLLIVRVSLLEYFVHRVLSTCHSQFLS